MFGLFGLGDWADCLIYFFSVTSSAARRTRRMLAERSFSRSGDDQPRLVRVFISNG